MTPANWFNLRVRARWPRLAMEIREGPPTSGSRRWARDTLRRLTSDPVGAAKPVWTPDSRRIVFASARADKSTLNLCWQRADGTGDAQRLTESRNSQQPGSWHPSGKVPGVRGDEPDDELDVMILPIEGDEARAGSLGQPTVFLNSTAVGARADVLAGRAVARLFLGCVRAR